jgi:hypothetical protein
MSTLCHKRSSFASYSIYVNALVGIDFDPFVNYQELADRYVVRRISQKGQAYMADIYAVWSGERREKLDVTAE